MTAAPAKAQQAANGAIQAESGTKTTTEKNVANANETVFPDSVTFDYGDMQPVVDSAKIDAEKETKNAEEDKTTQKDEEGRLQKQKEQQEHSNGASECSKVPPQKQTPSNTSALNAVPSRRRHPALCWLLACLEE